MVQNWLWMRLVRFFLANGQWYCGHTHTTRTNWRPEQSTCHYFSCRRCVQCCTNGTLSFDGFNINSLLTTGVDPEWWRFVHTPLEYIIKDTMGLYFSECDRNVCTLINLVRDYNTYDPDIYLASSTYWTTVGKGPIFDSTDHVTWFDTRPTTPPPPPLPTCCSSILFLPGFEASRVYKTSVTSCTVNCEDTLWEPNGNSDVEALFMTVLGESVDDSIYTRDVLDEAYSVLNIYKSFLEKMQDMK